MKSMVLILASAACVAAQPIPGRYIVVLKTEPAAAVSIHNKTRYSAADREVAERKKQIHAEHAAIEAAIGEAGGVVTHRFDTLLNALGARMDETAAERLRRDGRVAGVYPVMRHHILMDQAAVVHRFNQAYQMISGGASNAGAGVKIGILDCGVDVNHPAFQNFQTPMPSGFPITSGTATASNVNNKVIVARVYSDPENGVDNSFSDGLDYCDHGTTVAGIAAGLPTSPVFNGIGTIQGVAPGAWIGNYKVADDFGRSDDLTFLAGLNDAFNDGMQVVNYSSGYLLYNYSDEDGPDAQAIANAVAGGMVFVGAAGNAGPGPGTVAAPAASPAAIAVGAIENQRWFWFSANFGPLGTFLATPAREELGTVSGDTVGPLVDVAAIGPDAGGYACSPLPAGSLSNSIALIQRGGPNGAACTFATKLNNAQRAGAIGAILYDNKPENLVDEALSGVDYAGYLLFGTAPADASGNAEIFGWSMGAATLPALLVSQNDGAAIKQLAAANANAQVDLDFDGKTAFAYPSNTIADFSSLGPTPLANVKPDIVAVGDNLVAPVTTQGEAAGCAAPFVLDLNNGCYPVYSFLDSPFQAESSYGLSYGQYFDDAAGTSFAAPMVTGAVAVAMAQFPGLNGAQYRSLIVNSAGELDLYPNGAMAAPQSAGAGRLDLSNALGSGLAASSISLNFAPAATPAGSGGADAISPARARLATPRAAPANASEAVTITNTGPNADTFAVTVTSIDGIAVPAVDQSSFPLAPGASQTINVSIPGAAQLASGQYHGFLWIEGTQGQTPLRIPYWYGVAGSSAANLLVLYNPGVDPSGCSDAIDFRILDAVGLPFEPAAAPTVTTANARAQVVSVAPIGDISGTFEAQIVTGRPDQNGGNEFTISAGNTIFPPVFIAIDTSGFTSCGGAALTGTTSARAVSLLKSRGITARRRKTGQAAIR